MLGRETAEHDGGVLLVGDPSQLGLRFVSNSAAKTRPNLAHFHLTSETDEDQHDTVGKALSLGAQHLAFGQTADEGHMVMADPEGNELCVIEPGNDYLAGCGFFGELACDGSREVGLFWSAALGWPLVWDKGSETAIQSPEGGTKISWGGEAAAPPAVRRSHRFYLLAINDVQTEADRLVALGAVRRSGGQDNNVALNDPDGNEFELVGQ